MIGVAIAPTNRRKIGAAQRITHFQVVLAPCHLSSMSPSGRRIVAKWIVCPFADLMGKGVGVALRGAE